MTEKPEFIYFDLDDTLLDHNNAEVCALRDVHAHFDVLQSADVQQFVDVYHEINKSQWERYSTGEVDRHQLQRNRFELTLQKLGEGGSRYHEIGQFYMQRYSTHWRWVAGAREAFETIKQKYEVGILTNGFSETQKKKFKQFDLHSKAKHLVISEEVGFLKPHPKIFEYATSLTGLKASEILYIGDSYNSDVVGATDFGWNVAWFTANGNGMERDEADFVFSDFNDLCDFLKVNG